MTALRIPVPSQTQERARNAANMLASVASTLQGFTTADGVMSAEIKLKRAKDEITALQAAMRGLKSDAKRMEQQRIRDRAIVERDAVGVGA
jgi:hypothetical protein